MIVMSKERELLGRVVNSNWQIGTIPVVLHEEIENLLAQPESFKPEPLSVGCIQNGLSSEEVPDYKAMTFIKQLLKTVNELYTLLIV